MWSKSAGVKRCDERVPDRRECERGAGERATDAADIAVRAFEGAWRRPSAKRSLSPYAATGIPPPIGLPTTTTSGSRSHAAVAPPGPDADRVRLVDREQRAGRAGDLAQRVVVAGFGMDDADVRQRGLARAPARHRRAPVRARAPPMSLNSTIRVVSAGSIGGPAFPGRGDDARRLPGRGASRRRFRGSSR